MPVIPDWRSAENSGNDWDTLKLDGQPLPGVAQISLKMPPGIDIQKPSGGRGARIVDTGLPPVMLHCKLTLPTPEELNAFLPFMPIFRPKAKGAAVKKVRVTHPQALIWGFTDVVIFDVEVPAVKGGGAYIIEFNMAERTDDPPKVKEKKPANDSSAGGASPDQLADKLKADGKRAREDNT